MACSNMFLNNLLKYRNFSSTKRYFAGGKVIFSKQKATASSSSTSIPAVQGLSKACVNVPNQPVGPGAAKNTGYKNPEYFCYDKTSYFEAEIEMLNYRCPQPSKFVPYFQDKK
ncbi:unnamed protein product [Acanthoscelides obtectus]|uniref:NADH dehydrogenase [ubiquinone] flavoprotein 3, mitochondrial n=1 Tax=Acanthoscelides obtectus TaxID=200917 RepID=A0A9P0JQ82_ACAOB|nr:unnamed protein product [Acanthoscelides obtectus]CAK1661789.1 hypothetical protein AOBTE_LOCUS22802 [Acanthoscelides obtectus]